jgi:hypothetical protein
VATVAEATADGLRTRIVYVQLSSHGGAIVGQCDCVFWAEFHGLLHRLKLVGRHVTVPSDVGDAPVIVLDEIGHQRVTQAVSNTPVWIDLDLRHLPLPPNNRGRLSKW